MLRGKYLEDLLYFYFGVLYLYFGMQLSIDLCDAISVHEQLFHAKTHLKYIA